MNINNWKNTWGTIDWRLCPDNEIKQKIIDFQRTGVDFNTTNEDDWTNWTPLHYAVRFGKRESAKYLIENGVNLDAKTFSGNTVLHFAAEHYEPEIVEALLNVKPDLINKTNACGQTALHGAASNGDIKTIKVLATHGADVTIQSDAGWSVLHEAVFNDYAKAVQTLIELGAPVDAKDKFHWTALLWAADRGFVETVKVLIEQGADINITNADGRTALSRAKDLKVKELLLNAGKIRADYLKKYPTKVARQNKNMVNSIAARQYQ